MAEQFMPRVNGKSWHCECGCNVFHKPDGEPDVFECNACGAWFTDKEEVKARIERGNSQYAELIALAKSNPNYRLAVVDLTTRYQHNTSPRYRVVKMEDE